MRISAVNVKIRHRSISTIQLHFALSVRGKILLNLTSHLLEISFLSTQLKCLLQNEQQLLIKSKDFKIKCTSNLIRNIKCKHNPTMPFWHPLNQSPCLYSHFGLTWTKGQLVISLFKECLDKGRQSRCNKARFLWPFR